MTDVSGPCDPGFYCIRGSKVPNPAGIVVGLFDSKAQLSVVSHSVIFNRPIDGYHTM